jgi:hypothetical protein
LFCDLHPSDKIISGTHLEEVTTEILSLSGVSEIDEPRCGANAFPHSYTNISDSRFRARFESKSFHFPSRAASKTDPPFTIKLSRISKCWEIFMPCLPLRRWEASQEVRCPIVLPWCLVPIRMSPF